MRVLVQPFPKGDPKDPQQQNFLVIAGRLKGRLTGGGDFGAVMAAQVPQILDDVERLIVDCGILTPVAELRPHHETLSKAKGYAAGWSKEAKAVLAHEKYLFGGWSADTELVRKRTVDGIYGEVSVAQAVVAALVALRRKVAEVLEAVGRLAAKAARAEAALV